MHQPFLNPTAGLFHKTEGIPLASPIDQAVNPEKRDRLHSQDVWRLPSAAVDVLFPDFPQKREPGQAVAAHLPAEVVQPGSVGSVEKPPQASPRNEA